MPAPAKVLRSFILAGAMVTRAALAFRPVLAFAYSFGANGEDAQPSRRLIGSSAQQRQQSAHRGHALQRLNVWNALRRTGRTDDNNTVEQSTAGMSGEQRDAWLRQQLAQTVKEMAGKGLQLDTDKIGTAYFASPDSPRRGAGIDHWRGKNHLEINREDARLLTVKELRAIMAHEVAQTQPNLGVAYEHAGKTPASAMTYGAKIHQNALRKLQSASWPEHSAPLTTRESVIAGTGGHSPQLNQDNQAEATQRETRPQPVLQNRQSPLSR